MSRQWQQFITPLKNYKGDALANADYEAAKWQKWDWLWLQICPQVDYIQESYWLLMGHCIAVVKLGLSWHGLSLTAISCRLRRTAVRLVREGGYISLAYKFVCYGIAGYVFLRQLSKNSKQTPQKMFLRSNEVVFFRRIDEDFNKGVRRRFCISALPVVMCRVMWSLHFKWTLWREDRGNWIFLNGNVTHL